MGKLFFGIGQETTVGPATAPAAFFPFMADTQEQCVLCGYIDDRDRMHFAGFTDDGETSSYVCGRPHIPA
jgi:hypothetical protein